MGSLFWGMLFGVIGAAYLAYAKRQREVVPLFSGVGLMVFPFAVSNVYAMIAIGGALMALPFFVEL